MEEKYYCNVYVVDEIMGAGKSSAAINFINSSDSKVIYVTPYLDEVIRIKEACKKRDMKEPSSKKTKLRSLKELVKNGENIVTTHALFHLFDRELIDMCWWQGYTLILDEVTDVIEPYEGLESKEDFDVFTQCLANVNEETGIIEWKDGVQYDGHKFAEEKILCDMNCLAYYGGTVVMRLFPVEVFNAFRNVYILTYMFDAQMQSYYYKFHNLPYKRIFIKGDTPVESTFTENEEERVVIRNDFKSLIHIIDDDKMNMIGDRDTDLSKSWYDRNAKNGGLIDIRKNLTNFFINKTGKGIGNNLWTTFVDYKKSLQGKGYTRGFAAMNSRASNKWGNCDCVAYTVNRYVNPLIVNFFSRSGIKVDEDAFALSEMLQFIWRSSIRNGKPIWIYIPSKRMRNLLIKWIDENSCEKISVA